MALANATRAFCPPLKVTPFSPISVLSPAGNIYTTVTNSYLKINDAQQMYKSD